MVTIPPIDTKAASAASDSETIARNEGHDFRELEAEVKRKENINREADQRYSLRFWSVIVTSSLILIFVTVLIYLLLNIKVVLGRETPFPVIIALYLAPLTASTVLGVSLLAAAFRGYKEGDASEAASAANSGTRTVSSFV